MNITLARHTVTLLPEKAVWIDALGLLCVADLHFEKGSFFSRFGSLLPPYDSEETLARLEQLVARYRPEIVIAAGDSFHDRQAASRLKAETMARLNRLVDSVAAFHWLSGNHDPEPVAEIRGLRAVEHLAGNILFCHQTASRAEAEISGHFHPKIRLDLRGHKLSAACFALHGERLILPAFGHYTGGLNVESEAFRRVMPAARRRLFVPHNGQVFAV